MASVAELRAQNEHMAREIYALLCANTKLEKEAMVLTSEYDKQQFTGSEQVQALEEELKAVDEEIASLRLQCQSMTKVIRRVDVKKEIKVEEEPAPVIDHTMQRDRGTSMPRHRRSSAMKMAAHGLAKAASYMTMPTAKPSSDELLRRPKMNKDSPPILSYAKGASGSTKSLLSLTHSHYGNFRRRSGPCRKNRDPVMVP